MTGNRILKILGIFLFNFGLIFLVLTLLFFRKFNPYFFLIMTGGGALYYFNRHAYEYSQGQVIWIKEQAKWIRPIFKYSLFSFLAIALLIGIGFFFGNEYFKKKNTNKEGGEIVEALNKYYSEKGSYPDNLDEIISNNPMRKTWTKDSWDIPYKYSVMEGGKNFNLTSAGKDKEFKTEDDLVFKKE